MNALLEPVETVLAEAAGLLLVRQPAGAGTPLILRSRHLPMPKSAQERLHNEYAVRERLQPSWSARPLRLDHTDAGETLLLEDPGCALLEAQLSGPWHIDNFLAAATALATAVSKLHGSGLIHRDLRPDRLFYDADRRQAWISGFGWAVASTRAPAAGAEGDTQLQRLAYMAPEQTGRMNRQVDARGDLYSLGVIFYRMLTGALPFAGRTALEMLHGHLAMLPQSPRARRPELPEGLAAIVLQLLAKSADERYPNAASLVADLRRCEADWTLCGHIDVFETAQAERARRPLLPQGLYGRDVEQRALADAVERIRRGGPTELVLVAGFSGVGKSALVSTLAMQWPSRPLLFASGKADQFQRGLPYGALAQALRVLASWLEAGDASARQACGEALREALGVNARVLTQLVPAFDAILGPSAPVPELSPQDAATRFHAVMRRVLQVFATAARPLLLFIDDLQWLDDACLNLMEDLLAEPTLRHVLLVAAYRSNEVAPADPLGRRIEDLRASGRVSDIALAPLSADALAHFVGDALQCPPAAAASLSQAVHARTAGNPFFAVQYLLDLVDDGLVSFDEDDAAWHWDDRRIERSVAGGGVVSLMVNKLGRLPPPTRRVLERLACLGTRSNLATLARISGRDAASVRTMLWQAASAGLVLQAGGEVYFLHDRILEAAYANVPAPRRRSLHLGIGLRLLANPGAQDDGEKLFELVNQLNLGAQRIRRTVDKDRLAELNLRSARRARATTAYATALKCIETAMDLLGAEAADRQPALFFELQLLRAECEFLARRDEVARALLLQLLPVARSRTDSARVQRLLIVLHVVRSEYAQAVAHAIDGLSAFGIVLSAHPSRAQVDQACQALLARLDAISIESLETLADADDADVDAAMNMLAELFAPACFTDESLALLHLCHMVGLTLDRGLTPASTHGLAWFGIMIGHHFGRHGDAQRLAAVARRIVEQRGFTALEAKSLFALEITGVWMQPLSQAIESGRAAFAAGIERGDLAVACFACNHIVNDMLVRGDALAAVADQIEAGMAIVQRAGFRDVVDELLTQRRFVLALRGLTRTPASFDGEDFESTCFEQSLTPQRMPTMIFWYWVLRAQATLIAGDFAGARALLERASGWLWSSPVHVQYLNYHLFGALAWAGSEAAPQVREHVAAHLAPLQHWEGINPQTFADKAALVRAELARLEGRAADAARGYEQALQLAQDNGFVQVEALTAECAARFHQSQGLHTPARAYARQARDAYRRWGATAKAAALEAAHPSLADPADSRIDEAPADALDLATVKRISEAIGGEIDLQALMHTLMVTALEHAGAQRGLLMLPQAEAMRVRARAGTGRDRIDVQSCDDAPRADELPLTLLQEVCSRRQSVLLDDAVHQPALADDPYIRRRRPRSLLCLPLLKQSRLVAVLYLENNLASRVFTPPRIAVLELVANQAAIALENARLYAELRSENHERRVAEHESRRAQAALLESEVRFRHMADATPDVLWITEIEPERVVYASPSFERIWGASVEQLYHDPRLWVHGIHPDDRDRIGQDFGSWIVCPDTPWENEYRIQRPDGGVRWIHERGFAIRDSQGRPHRVSGISTDITAQREAAAALRASEERFALAVAASNDGIWDWNLATRQLFMSQQAQRLFGLPPGLLEQRDDDWMASVQVHPDDADRQRRQLADYLADRAPAYDGEWRVKHPDGRWRWLRVRGLCVRDASGRATRLAGSVSDIDAHRRAEAALLQAQRLEAVGTLASGIAHDFNNILGAILGFGESAMRFTRAGSKLRRDLACIIAAGERGRSLVERILVFSRSGVGKRVPVSVEGVVREALDLIEATLPPQVTVRTTLATGQTTTLGDSTQVHQLLMNLATNAIQAMPEGGTLSVDLRVERLHDMLPATTGALPAGDYVVLSVRDTGEGIAPDILERIFDPFFTTKDVGAGTGLGLSLVHGIVFDAGGAIHVSSQPGKGSTFTVYLPQHAGETREPQAPSPVRAPLPAGRRVVMVVDDDAAMLQWAAEALSEAGFATLAFTSGEEARTAFAADPRRVDVLVTDERMPNLSGTALIEAVRALNPAVPAVLITGYLGSEVAQRARDAGANALLGKPLAAGELVDAVRRLAGGAAAPASGSRRRSVIREAGQHDL